MTVNLNQVAMSGISRATPWWTLELPGWEPEGRP